MNIVGQKHIVDDLVINISASRERGKPLPHTMFHGSSGGGKTMFAEYLGELLDLKIKGKPKFIRTTGGRITTKNDIEDLALSIGDHDVVFIDEIHDLAKRGSLREILYEIMDKFSLSGIKIRPFTLVGATTEIGSIPFEFRNRFPLVYKIEDYTNDEIAQILVNMGCPKEIAEPISRRSRGVPRVAIGYYYRVKNEAMATNKKLSVEVVENVFKRNKIDDLGLTATDHKILKLMLDKQAYLRRNAIGVNALADQCGINEEDLKIMHEPFLIKLGMIERNPKGRILTQTGKEYVE